MATTFDPKKPPEPYALKSAKDVTIDSEFHKTFVLGDYGSGKSVFASTYPTPGYVFDFDKGIMGYRGKDFNYDQFELSPKGWVEFEKTFLYIRKQVEAGVYQTVIVDSTTTMTDIAMERALQLDPKRTDEGGPLWNVHYQIVKNLMEPKLHALMRLPCNVVMNGHWKVTTDQKTGAILSVDPLLTGQLAEKVPGYFDEVYASFVKTVNGQPKYTIRLVTKGFYKARSRISGPARLLPDELPNDYNELRKAINKAKEKEGGE